MERKPLKLVDVAEPCDECQRELAVLSFQRYDGGRCGQGRQRATECLDGIGTIVWQIGDSEKDAYTLFGAL